MIIGRIEFGPQLVITPRAYFQREEKQEIALGMWKLLGLEVSVDMASDNVCFDEEEMKERNLAAALRLKKRS
jgi:hypothetical protein